MSGKLEVSFNSPQCGWMSIGFDNGLSEFHTTTAYTPHEHALSEILKGLSSLLEPKTAVDKFVIAWSRNPEAYDFYFRRKDETITFMVVEFPTFNRLRNEGETVFLYKGNVRDFCNSFYETFAQLYKDRETDEFESNWHQPFPLAEFEKFSKLINSL